MELRRVITDKEEEILALKSGLEEKELQMAQFEIDARDSMKRIINDHTSKLTDELETQKN